MTVTHSDHALATRFLDVIEHDIVPLTRAGVARGDKVFGGAILRKSDLSLVIAATNRETENPLFHGEISTLNAFFALAGSARPAPEDCPVPLDPRALLAVPVGDHLGRGSTTSTTSSATWTPRDAFHIPMTCGF